MAIRARMALESPHPNMERLRHFQYGLTIRIEPHDKGRHRNDSATIRPTNIRSLIEGKLDAAA